MNTSKDLSLGLKLRRERVSRGWSQVELANRLGVTALSVSHWERGARGVIATEFHVPDWLAAVIAEELYERSLPGTPVGEVLFATRRHLCEHRHNPLGLAYALYSPPDIRIVNSSKDPQRSINAVR